jgi:hypothetical protein
MKELDEPSEENGFLCEHVVILRNSYRHWTARDLVPHRLSDLEAARYLFEAPFALLSHDTAKDPVFNYANHTALSLFAMSWQEITALPSRLSAETVGQEERNRLLAVVSRDGYIDDYCGVRIGRHGRRFSIENATVWNLLGPEREACGQAAQFEHWQFL